MLDAADTVVWLGYDRWLVCGRVVRRTLRRLVTRQQLWNGNREPWSNLWSRDPHRNVIVWSWASHPDIRELDAADADERWVRLRSPAATRRWLASLPPQPRWSVSLTARQRSGSLR